jgi:hypothetical protein
MGSAARTFPGIASAPTRASRPLPVPALQSPIKIAGWHDHPPLPFTLEGASSSEAGAARGGGAASLRPTTARPAWAVDDGGGRARRGGLAACAAAAPCAGRGPATTLLVRRRAVVGMAVACVVAAEKEDESERKSSGLPPSLFFTHIGIRRRVFSHLRALPPTHTTHPTHHTHHTSTRSTMLLTGSVSLGRAAVRGGGSRASSSRSAPAPARASLLRPALAAPLAGRRAAAPARRGRGGLACRAMFERFTEVSDGWRERQEEFFSPFFLPLAARRCGRGPAQGLFCGRPGRGARACPPALARGRLACPRVRVACGAVARPRVDSGGRGAENRGRGGCRPHHLGPRVLAYGSVFSPPLRSLPAIHSRPRPLLSLPLLRNRSRWSCLPRKVSWWAWE